MQPQGGQGEAACCGQSPPLSGRQPGKERINKELKRRNRVAGDYSNDQSLLRVAVCIMMDINKDCITGKRYLSLEE
jgi:hypothetical protein